MADPLKNRKNAEANFRLAKAASVRRASRKVIPGFQSYTLGKVADAVEGGKAEVKIGKETISLDTPDKIDQVVRDVLDGKYK